MLMLPGDNDKQMEIRTTWCGVDLLLNIMFEIIFYWILLSNNIFD